jgi:hypothetical protein
VFEEAISFYPFVLGVGATLDQLSFGLIQRWRIAANG